MQTPTLDTLLDVQLDAVEQSAERDKGFILTLEGSWSQPVVQVLDARILFHYTDSTFCRQKGMTIMLLFDLKDEIGNEAFEAWKQTGLGATFRERINNQQATSWMHIGEERLLLHRILMQTLTQLKLPTSESIEVNLNFF